MERYPQSVEESMKRFYSTLSEKDKRRYAGIETLKLGHGGIVYISRLFGCEENTIKLGMKEIRDNPENAEYDPAIRRPGGGRKGYEEKFPGIDEKFLDVLKEYTAGDPMDENVLWTNLTKDEIAEKIYKKFGIKISITVVRKLLRKHNYKRRKAQKTKTLKNVKNRNEQFENIKKLISDYEKSGDPIISIDTKKKEYLGEFYREGYTYNQEPLSVYDHDFNSFAQGIVIPHGIFDYKQNTGYMNIGTSKDTSEFACDSIKNWWYNEGRHRYPNAKSILVLCDGGGSNGSRHYIFKEDLQHLVDEIGIKIRIAHYPPYTSKYNPIEHRLFSFVTKSCKGVIFKSVDIVKQLVEKTKTKKGLRVTAQIIDKVYKIGRKYAKDFKKNMRILFDDFLPEWNYVVVPE